MNNDPSIARDENSWSIAMALGRFRSAWVSFWFTPIDPIGLHSVRFLAGLLFIFWLAPLYSEYTALFGMDGWFGRQGYIAASQLPDGPPFPVRWSLLFVFGNSPAALQ